MRNTRLFDVAVAEHISHEDEERIRERLDHLAQQPGDQFLVHGPDVTITELGVAAEAWGLWDERGWYPGPDGITLSFAHEGVARACAASEAWATAPQVRRFGTDGKPVPEISGPE